MSRYSEWERSNRIDSRLLEYLLPCAERIDSGLTRLDVLRRIERSRCRLQRKLDALSVLIPYVR